MHIPYKKKILTLIIAYSLLCANAAEATQKTILAFGDSLTAGYNLPLEKAFPAQLEVALQKQGYDVKVINAGVSGDTTSGGLTRLEWTLEKENPEFVILELGANDMLRGTDPLVTQGNLEEMLIILKKKKIQVLLTGMKVTSNLDMKFRSGYQIIYPALAKKYETIYYPFFMEGVALRPGMTQSDGMHPTASGVAALVKNILPSVKELLERQ